MTSDGSGNWHWVGGYPEEASSPADGGNRKRDTERTDAGVGVGGRQIRTALNTLLKSLDSPLHFPPQLSEDPAVMGRALELLGNRSSIRPPSSSGTCPRSRTSVFSSVKWVHSRGPSAPGELCRVVDRRALSRASHSGHILGGLACPLWGPQSGAQEVRKSFLRLPPCQCPVSKAQWFHSKEEAPRLPRVPTSLPPTRLEPGQGACPRHRDPCPLFFNPQDKGFLPACLPSPPRPPPPPELSSTQPAPAVGAVPALRAGAEIIRLDELPPWHVLGRPGPRGASKGK